MIAFNTSRPAMRMCHEDSCMCMHELALGLCGLQDPKRCTLLDKQTMPALKEKRALSQCGAQTSARQVMGRLWSMLNQGFEP